MTRIAESLMSHFSKLPTDSRVFTHQLFISCNAMGSRRFSLVWKHFEQVNDDEVVCMHCLNGIKYSTPSTHNLIRHLRLKHAIVLTKGKADSKTTGNTVESEVDQSEMVPDVIITQEQIKQILQSSQSAAVSRKEAEVHTNAMEISKGFIEQEESEFDAFGRNVVLQLKALPLKEALEAEELILGILRKQRIRVLDRR